MLNGNFWNTLITVVIAVLGWIVAHYFSSKRDRKLKRREIITTHLITAYRILANDITRREADREWKLKLETIISELQLFGSVKQVQLAKKLADDVTRSDDFYVDDLLNDLRNELRKELKLTPIDGNVVWLRFESTKK